MSRILPILFNTDMVRAILSGSKTTTRRCVKHPIKTEPKYKLGHRVGDVLWVRESWQQVYETEIFEAGEELNIKNVISNFDDISKVCVGLSTECATPNTKPRNKYYVYKADDIRYADEKYSLRWKPSIHMPKEAARIFLKVTGVRMERLQDITIDEIRKEGLSSMAVYAGDKEIAYKEWQMLWDSTINKKELNQYGWDANPWVWVIEFERCEKPVKF